MSFWPFLRTLLLAVASFGYLANGAQAHLHVSGAETLEVMLCGIGASHTTRIEIPGEPIEEADDTCCGDCVSVFGIETPARVLLAAALDFSQPVPSNLPTAISPRSPLWPGAPPQGPPNPTV